MGIVEGATVKIWSLLVVFSFRRTLMKNGTNICPESVIVILYCWFMMFYGIEMQRELVGTSSHQDFLQRS